MTYNVFGGTLNSTQSSSVILDEFAEKAEQQRNFSFMTKSNALRKAANEKDSDVTSCCSSATGKAQTCHCK